MDTHRLGELRSPRLEVRARDLATAGAALAGAGLAPEANDGALYLRAPRALERPDEVAAILVAAGTPPTHLAVEQEELEAHFMRLTGAK
jgi:ABC-2 type transport system ATP-binding protein